MKKFRFEILTHLYVLKSSEFTSILRVMHVCMHVRMCEYVYVCVCERLSD